MNNCTIYGAYPFHIQHCIHLYDELESIPNVKNKNTDM